MRAFREATLADGCAPWHGLAPGGAQPLGAHCRNASTDPNQAADRLDGYRQALEEHFCITVTDPSGRLLEVNDRFCQVIGYAD